MEKSPQLDIEEPERPVQLAWGLEERQKRILTGMLAGMFDGTDSLPPGAECKRLEGPTIALQRGLRRLAQQSFAERMQQAAQAFFLEGRDTLV